MATTSAAGRLEMSERRRRHVFRRFLNTIQRQIKYHDALHITDDVIIQNPKKHSTVTEECLDMQLRSAECHAPAAEDSCTFCSRPAGGIICRACGHTFKGRVQSSCTTHPDVVQHSDIQNCPKCSSYKLKEF